MWRRAIATVVVGSGLCVWGPLVGVGVALAEGEDAALLAATNVSRQQMLGGGELIRAADLDEAARVQAQAMASRGALFHTPDLGAKVQDWETVAENVGVGVDVASVHQAFLDSPAHRANVLNDRVSEMGIGIVAEEGKLWVVEVFRKPAHAAAPTAAVVPATVPTRRVVVRRPAPTPVDEVRAPVSPRPSPAEVPPAPVEVPETLPVVLAEPRYVPRQLEVRTVVVAQPVAVASETAARLSLAVAVSATLLWLLVASCLRRQLLGHLGSARLRRLRPAPRSPSPAAPARGM